MTTLARSPHAARNVETARADLAELEAGTPRGRHAAAIGARAERAVHGVRAVELRRTAIWCVRSASRAGSCSTAGYRVARTPARGAAEYRMMRRVPETRSSMPRVPSSAAERHGVADERLGWTRIRASSTAGSPLALRSRAAGRPARSLSGDAVLEVVAPDSSSRGSPFPDAAMRRCRPGMGGPFGLAQEPHRPSGTVDVIGVTARRVDRNTIGVASTARAARANACRWARADAKIHAGSHSILGTLLRRCSARVVSSVLVVQRRRIATQSDRVREPGGGAGASPPLWEGSWRSCSCSRIPFRTGDFEVISRAPQPRATRSKAPAPRSA